MSKALREKKGTSWLHLGSTSLTFISGPVRERKREEEEEEEEEREGSIYVVAEREVCLPLPLPPSLVQSLDPSAPGPETD